MTELTTLLPLMRRALSEPRETATTVLALGVPRVALWPAFFALVALSVILVYLGALLAPGAAGLERMPAPLGMAALTAVVSAASVWAVWFVGSVMGGTGRFDEALLLTVFLQSILLAGQAIEFLLALVLPPIAGLFGLALIVAALWLNVNFIAALHGFASLFKSLGVLFLASLVVAIAMVVLLTITGFGPVGDL